MDVFSWGSSSPSCDTVTGMTAALNTCWDDLECQILLLRSGESHDEGDHSRLCGANDACGGLNDCIVDFRDSDNPSAQKILDEMSARERAELNKAGKCAEDQVPAVAGIMFLCGFFASLFGSIFLCFKFCACCASCYKKKDTAFVPDLTIYVTKTSKIESMSCLFDTNHAHPVKCLLRLLKVLRGQAVLSLFE